jgi:acyl-coenzyme A synthetase/AMP-(fatty) acid ligase
MTKPLPETSSLARLIEGGAGRDRVIATRDHVLPLDDFARASSLGSQLARLEGRSVILFVRDMAKAAAALIDLDGLARRIVLCPPGWEPSRLEAVVRDAEADALVHDGEEDAARISVEFAAPCRLPLQPLDSPRAASRETEWILPTSGTSGPAKLVVHTLRTLTGAIAEAPLRQWATFYDIRRYGGLQIFLRALSGRGSLHLCGFEESVESFLIRLGAAAITHISGTPSHWRKVLMSREARRIDPDMIRLSGEIADDAVLKALGALYPRARIKHAYASTEAGVIFAVDDGKAGFPASWLQKDGTVQMRIVDGALRVRSDRCALRSLGAQASALADKDGFVDTGDIVERRGDRVYFVGRRDGVINVGGAKVHPEEIEAALNAHAAVRGSLVFGRKNPITGALVVAEVVLRDQRMGHAESEREILAACRASLAPHMVPARLRFVAELPMSDGGKLARHSVVMGSAS